MGPGPGEYDPYKDALAKPENANLHEEASVRYEAKIPRYHEAIVKDNEKKVVFTPHRLENLVRGGWEREQRK